jgi:hypothetical protein
VQLPSRRRALDLMSVMASCRPTTKKDWPDPLRLVHRCESPLPRMAGRRRLITMARRRHTPEQIIRTLREADRLLAEGAEVADVARHLDAASITALRRSSAKLAGPPRAGR